VPFCYFTFIKIWKADLLHMYGGVVPKMAEEAHPLAIDQATERDSTTFHGI
jgi:tRNA A37 threonylcarbamoyltransferase TsaD